MIDLLPGDWAQFGYLALLAVFLGGALLFEYAGRRNQAMRAAAVWALIFGVAVAGAGWWQGRMDRQQVFDGRRIELPLGQDGHFHLTAEVNGAPIRFVVDTGASTVVLGREDAARAGIDPDDLAYIGTAQTANGQVETAPVTLDRVAVGEIVDEDVPAQVNGGAMPGSLLGMSYLRRFARVSFEGDRMVLER